MVEVKNTVFIEITEGRLFELLQTYYALVAKDQESWGKLLKTKKYHKRQQTADNVYKALLRQIDKNYFPKAKELFPDITQYTVKLTGSKQLFYVAEKRHQKYELVFH